MPLFSLGVAAVYRSPYRHVNASCHAMRHPERDLQGLWQWCSRLLCVLRRIVPKATEPWQLPLSSPCWKAVKPDLKETALMHQYDIFVVLCHTIDKSVYVLVSSASLHADTMRLNCHTLAPSYALMQLAGDIWYEPCTKFSGQTRSASDVRWSVTRFRTQVTLYSREENA